MALFGKKPNTLEEVRKAYENLSDDDKKKFHQSIADRVHESIGEQEHDAGETDSQSAEAHEHEALGAEHADGKGEVDELHEEDDTPEEKHEDAEAEAKADESKEEDNRDEVVQRLTDRVGALEETVKSLSELKDKMEDYTRKQEESFGLKGRSIGGKKDMTDMTADELKSAILSGNN